MAVSNGLAICRRRDAPDGPRPELKHIRPAMAVDLYCWRRKAVVPVLAEHEWRLMESVLTQQIQSIKYYCVAHAAVLPEALKKDLDKPAPSLCRELTGHTAISADSIRHHRISIHGPPASCGKPLRTP